MLIARYDCSNVGSKFSPIGLFENNEILFVIFHAIHFTRNIFRNNRYFRANTIHKLNANLMVFRAQNVQKFINLVLLGDALIIY